MLDVKTWLEGTEMKVEEERFLKPPALPYIIFTEDTDVSGADNKNCIANRGITIELYSDKINKAAAELKIETLLNEKSIQYKRNRTWIDSEKLNQTVYDFDLIEKF
jgi:hypothetical protein